MGFHRINLKMAEMLKQRSPCSSEWRFCCHCHEATKETESGSTEESEIDDEDVDYSNELEKEEKCNKLNESVSVFDICPSKSYRLQKGAQISMTQEKLKRSYKKPKELASDILEILGPEFESPTGTRMSEKELVTRAADHSRVLS